MKHKIFNVFASTAIVLTVLIGCATVQKTNYVTEEKSNEKYLKGIINKSILDADSNYIWLSRDMKYTKANEAAVATFKQQKSKFKLVVFGGTWCEDTHNLLPKFYKLIEKSEYPEKNILLIAVDKNKQTINDLQNKYNVKQVPTFIVMQGDKEIGRVVEYGKYNDIEKELAEIVSKL
jgi:thiol-disulfide isomerase/thioredoxin